MASSDLVAVHQEKTRTRTRVASASRDLEHSLIAFATYPDALTSWDNSDSRPYTHTPAQRAADHNDGRVVTDSERGPLLRQSATITHHATTAAVTGRSTIGSQSRAADEGALTTFLVTTVVPKS